MGTTTARIDRTPMYVATGDWMEDEREDWKQLRQRAAEEPVVGRPDDGGAR